MGDSNASINKAESRICCIVTFCMVLNSGFKNSIESDTTQPICNRLVPNRINTDIRYEKGIESVETW